MTRCRVTRHVSIQIVICCGRLQGSMCSGAWRRTLMTGWSHLWKAETGARAGMFCNKVRAWSGLDETKWYLPLGHQMQVLCLGVLKEQGKIWFNQEVHERKLAVTQYDWARQRDGRKTHSFIHSEIFLTSVVVQSFSCIWLFVTSWTTAFQASLSLTYLPEFGQTHVHWVSDAIQPSHPPESHESVCARNFAKCWGYNGE